jgi:hypothetical protein
MDKNSTHKLRAEAAAQPAAVSTNYPCAVPNKGIDRTAISDVWSLLTVKFQTIICIILLLFYNSFINYTHYFKRRNCDSVQYSLHKWAAFAGAEAGHHNSSSGTIHVPYTVEDAAADAGPAA